MVKLMVKVVIKQEGIEFFKNEFKNFIDETRKENGCISFQLFQDADNPKVFFVGEEWASQEHLENHQKSKHFLKMQEIEKDIRENLEIHRLTLVK